MALGRVDRGRGERRRQRGGGARPRRRDLPARPGAGAEPGAGRPAADLGTRRARRSNRWTTRPRSTCARSAWPPSGAGGGGACAGNGVTVRLSSPGPTSRARRSRATTTVPSKCSAARSTHSCSASGCGRGDEVREDEGADAVAGGRPRRVLDGRVVVQDVGQPWQADGLDQVAAHHRVHEHVGPRAQLVESGAGTVSPAITTEHSVLVDPVAHGRAHGCVVGGCRGDPDRLLGEDLAALALDDLGGRPPLRSAWWAMR